MINLSQKMISNIPKKCRIFAPCFGAPTPTLPIRGRMDNKQSARIQTIYTNKHN